jgi:hypothetical protein
MQRPATQLPPWREIDCCGAAGVVAHGYPPEEKSMHLISFAGWFALSVAVATVGLAPAADAAGRDHATILAQGAPPQVCTEVYQPVCGTNQSGMRVTYSNACFARAAQATDVTPGECSK